MSLNTGNLAEASHPHAADDVARILIVDDDESMRLVTKEHLLLDYEVIDTGKAETALALAVEKKPDLILLDLAMPGLSGFELCHAFSSLSFTQHIPIFIISGQDERNKAFCESLGARRYFTKPIDFEKLKHDLAVVLQAKKIDRRADPRVELQMPLILRGENPDGSRFENRVATENVSRGGFLCACPTPLAEGLICQVSYCGEQEHWLGHARLVRIVNNEARGPRYGFQFLSTAVNTII